MLTTGSSQLVEQRLCFFEIRSTGRSAGLAPEDVAGANAYQAVANPE
jgi:hypothetical protein